MLWFFERGGDRLHCEIRPSTEVAGYELEWSQYGEVHVERSASVEDLAQRWAVLEQEWKNDGWVRVEDELTHQRPVSGTGRK